MNHTASNERPPRLLDDCPACPVDRLEPRQAAVKCTVNDAPTVLCGSCAVLIADGVPDAVIDGYCRTIADEAVPA